ncbi:MAG: LysR family transcriptional regulator [Bacteroidia bacterium]|jgi:LysR family hydrogen peroxide-inducible transcriptional activator|nr:LysR family transcriptional regulator [Bacteroidota bacterium]MCF8201311.1 LysR family transcriptional regulator [Bacteroidia bacterium]
MIVTLRQMQYVISVAKHGSFSKAADECAADQSTVSQQIKTFEDRMNTNIFDRSTLPITVTEKGKEIVLQCEMIISQVEDMIAPFKKKKNL